MAGFLAVGPIRRAGWLAFLVLAVASLSLPGRAAIAEAAAPWVEASLEQQLFQYTNAERAARGLAPLGWHPTLQDVARIRSWDMANRGYFSHYSPEGLSSFDILDGLGYRRRSQGENIGYNYLDESRSAASAIQMFMGSSPHATAILSRSYRYIGIGEASTARGAHYYTMVFSD